MKRGRGGGGRGVVEEVVDDDGFTFKRRVKGGAALRRREEEGEEYDGNNNNVHGRTVVLGAGVEQPPPRPGAELLYHVTKAMPDLHKSIPASWCVSLSLSFSFSYTNTHTYTTIRCTRRKATTLKKN